MFKPLTDSLSTNYKVEETDGYNLRFLRQNIKHFLSYCNTQYIKTPEPKILEVGPGNIDIKSIFSSAVIESIDIDPNAKATYTGNVCDMSKLFKDNLFDFIVCTEVFEHIKNPFNAATELLRIIKKNGLIFLTVPFNFMIHHNIEYFRFTENGLKVLFSEACIMEISNLPSLGRPKMPIQFTAVIKKP